jgi:hypothetical protein
MVLLTEGQQAKRGNLPTTITVSAICEQWIAKYFNFLSTLWLPHNNNKKIIIIIIYFSNNSSHWNSNEKLKEKFGRYTRKTFDKFTTKDSYSWNNTHNTESTAV